MSKLYEELPYGAPTSIKPFEVAIPQESLDKLQKLLEYAPIGALTFESSQEDRRYGISRKWLEEAKDYWEKTFDWSAN